MELAPTVPYPAYRLLDARPMENILRKSDFEFFDGPMWVLPDGIKSRSLKDYPNDFIGIRRVKAVAEFHGDGIHDGEILDGKLAEHGTNLTGRAALFNQWMDAFPTRFNGPPKPPSRRSRRHRAALDHRDKLPIPVGHRGPVLRAGKGVGRPVDPVG